MYRACIFAHVLRIYSYYNVHCLPWHFARNKNHATRVTGYIVLHTSRYLCTLPSPSYHHHHHHHRNHLPSVAKIPFSAAFHALFPPLLPFLPLVKEHSASSCFCSLRFLFFCGHSLSFPTLWHVKSLPTDPFPDFFLDARPSLSSRPSL